MHYRHACVCVSVCVCVWERERDREREEREKTGGQCARANVHKYFYITPFLSGPSFYSSSILEGSKSFYHCRVNLIHKPTAQSMSEHSLFPEGVIEASYNYSCISRRVAYLAPAIHHFRPYVDRSVKSGKNPFTGPNNSFTHLAKFSISSVALTDSEKEKGLRRDWQRERLAKA